MKLWRRWSAALLGLGVAGLLSAAVGPAQRATSSSAEVGGGTCQEWMCGTNHNQVLL